MEIGLDFDEHICYKCKGVEGGCAHCDYTGKTGNISNFQPALKYLIDKFGADRVLARKSSSGNGYHIRVLDIEIEPEAELELRETLGDCRGRRLSDRGRLSAGMHTSRLFDVKSTTEFSGDFEEVISTRTKTTKKWRSGRSFLET